VRSVVQEVVKEHNLRFAALPADERANVAENLLTLEDVASLKMDKSDFVFNKKTIGFRASGGR
jgi:hypothetical protein